MMAFRIAWFKVHEPLAFYAAYFYRRSQKGGFDAAMMTGGSWLRSSGVAPDRFIAFFYTGLGASLLLAGLLFGCNFAKALAAKGKA